MPKKHKRRVQPMCDPGLCDHCMYLGDGDFVCNLHGMGPGKTVFVVEGWTPTDHYLQCNTESKEATP